MHKAWTDYPIQELGDVPGKKAPIRECQIVGDHDRYSVVIILGATVSLVPKVAVHELPEEEP